MNAVCNCKIVPTGVNNNFYFARIKTHYLEHLLFAGYLVLFAWFVTKVKFFTNSGLTASQLVIIFLLKVMAGIFYGWIGIYYGNMAQMVDTWVFHHDSLIEYKVLLQDPQHFFTSVFHSPYATGYGGFFNTNNSWWNDLHGTILVKILALFHFFSLGNYYVNVIFFTFFTLFGPVALYRIMKDVYPHNHIAVLLTTFLIPSFLYWTSGIHKDGILFTGFGLVIYHVYFGLKEARWGWLRLGSILIGLLLVLALRSYLILVLVPALLAWVIAQKTPVRPLWVYGGVYFIFILFFFTAQYIFPRYNLPNAVTARQQEFLKLEGNSAIPTRELEPTLPGFIANAPQAIHLSLIKPSFSDIKHLLSLAAAIEINLLLSLFLVVLLWHRKWVKLDPFTLFCLFFSLSVLFTIGYTVNFLGAIVRYRSIVLPLLFVPVVALIQWERIGQLLFDIRSKNNI